MKSTGVKGGASMSNVVSLVVMALVEIGWKMADEARSRDCMGFARRTTAFDVVVRT